MLLKKVTRFSFLLVIGSVSIYVCSTFAKEKPVNSVHKQKIEPLVHHITENIGQLYHLNNTSVNQLRQSINESIETALEHDKSMESIVLNAKNSTNNLETVERLLSHPNTKKAFAKHLNAQQLQDYLSFTKARQQRVQQAYVHLITALLEQSLSLTTNQKTSITPLILDALNTTEQLEIERIAGQSFEKTIYFLDRKMVSSWDNILNKTQFKIWQVMLNMYENNSLGFKEMIEVETLQPPDEAAVKPHKQQEQLQSKTKEEIQESNLRELTEAVLDAHTEQLGIRNEQVLKRLDLTAKGVVEQFIEPQNHYANNRIPFIADLGNISMAVLTGKITRAEAIQKLNAMTKDLQDKENANNHQRKDEISRLADQPFIHETIENMIFDRISEITNHSLYQRAIKEGLSADAQAQYSKKQVERDAFLQQAARDVIVATYDVNLLMNNTQRKHLNSIAAQLTLPCISSEGLFFMIIQLYASITPEILSPWQHRQIKIE